ncbi:MAG: VPLPA-CTERM sorting domain-containing protein [Pseudomonadota bacterium]
MRPILSAALLATLLAGGAQAATFNLIFNLPDAVTESQREVVARAETLVESTILGYQDDIVIDAVEIDVGTFDEGPGGTLATAGPDETVERAGRILPTAGSVDFDVADLAPLEADGTLFDVFVHEVAHVLGFGTLWAVNGLSQPGSGTYTGALGLAAYRAEFDPDATFIPVELEFGPGTADSHWDEDWAGGINELMTGFIDAPVFASATTVATFEDLGYVTTGALVAPIPLPASAWLLLAGLGALGLRRRAT